MGSPTTEKLSPLKQAGLRVGTDLSDRWRIDRVLGVGGMGAVFACTHKNNGTRAAIKVLHAEFARALDVKERFLREGRIANRVDHPARVPVVDDGVSNEGEPYLVMELLEGMTLGELLRRGGGRVPLEKLLAVFDPVLELLGKCHELEIVHRDIKPANIFLTKQGAVKVLDFGVARMREPESNVEATRAGIALGTASFIAPEQALGMDKIDGRADLFSVGACLYTGVTGERLHAAKSEAEEFVIAATQSAPSVARKAPDLPPEVVALIDRSLAYEKSKRFQSAKEMRTELLKLLAAARAGQFKTARKGATGVVVKGNDAIEEGGELSEAEAREAAARLTSIFKQLGLAMAGVRQYGLTHPQTTRALSQAFAEIVSALTANPHAVRWEVMSDAFVFEEHPIWSPDRVPFDRIPHQLFADGVRKVQFKQGLTEEELRDFLTILLRDASGLFGDEDDSVTALWDRRFDHVAYLAVDSFAEGDNLEGEELEDWNELADRALELAKIDKDFDEQDLEAQALELNLQQTLLEAGDAAAALALDPMARATLGAQLVISPERWLEAYVDAFVPAYLDARARGDAELVHQALAEWTRDQIALHAADRVFEIHQAMTSAFRAQLAPEAAQQAELDTAKVMFPVETLRSLLTDLSSEHRGWGADRSQAGASAGLVAGLGRALELLASDAVFALACECLDSAFSEGLRDVLVPYLRRWSTGQEALLGSLLGRAGPELGKIVIEILGGLGTPKARAAIEAALANPDIEVKLAALAYFGEEIGDKAREEITALLDAPDVDVRKRTLELVARLSVVAAGPVLVRRIQSDNFHDLSVDERRGWLETVYLLKPARGEAVAIELLSKRRLLSSEATEQSRALAATLLGSCDSPEASEALQTAAKQRWGTSNVVREAATKALAQIEARRSSPAKAVEARSLLESKA